MRLTQFIETDGILLDYAMITNPDPLNVGAVADFSFVVSAPLDGTTITVAQITLVLPVGDPSAPDPADLTDVAPDAGAASISCTGTAKWTIAPGVGSGVFVVSPPDVGGTALAGDALTISFSGIQTSLLVGTARIAIAEWASKATPPDPRADPPSGTMAIAVPKFPLGFYAGNFTATPPEVQNGSTAVLSWIGSTNAEYYIYSGVAPKENVSSKRTWPTGKLSRATSYVLEASVTEAGVPTYIYFNLTIEVVDPSLIAQDVTVLTTSALQGGVTIGSQAVPAPLTVNGPISGNAAIDTTETVSATGLTINGDSSTTGTTTMNQAVSQGMETGTLGASGQTNLASTTINGPASLQGSVAAMTGAQTLSPGTSPTAYTAPTDGFVIFSVQGPSSYPTGGCMCWAACSTLGATAYTTGGNVGFFGPSWDDYMGNNWTSLTMPIAANVPFYVWAYQGSNGQQTDAAVNCWFIPFGSGAVNSKAVATPDAPTIEVPAVQNKIRRHWDAPNQFVTILETLLDRPVDPAIKQQMIDVLHTM